MYISALDINADLEKMRQLEEDCIQIRMNKFGISREQAQKEYDDLIHAFAMAAAPVVMKKAIQLLKINYPKKN
jgi:hypothetical protein